MAKGDKFYFENFAASTALSKEAALYLVECLENYDPAKMEQMLVAMHQLEHRADEKKHEMGAALAKAFVTPVDREDLDMLSRQLDDVADNIEEVLQMFYINNIQEMKPNAVMFAKNIVKSCELLCELMAEFENFKKSKRIKQLIITLNDVEEQCDSIYLHSMRELATSGADALTVIAWRDVYACLEACADAIEHASDCVDSVIMKNT
jgi:predicted phosphate transport protein (TIGR00153 family)